MQASVLLVDDERFARTVYADYLRAAGCSVEVAADVEAARRLLLERSFDVLLTDVVMPDGDGMQLLSDAKQADPDIQVVVITALDRVGPAVRAMRAGASDYLVKPVTPDALQLAVQRCLSTRALLAENTALRSHLNLFEACQRITSYLERDKLVPIALAALAAECRAPAAALVERDSAGDWRVTGTLGVGAEAEEPLAAALVPHADEVVAHGGAVPVALPASLQVPARRCLALPVGDGDAVLGAAFVFVRDDLDFERVGRAAFICRHVGMALRTLGRLSHVEHLAYVDDVTRLYNSRFLDVALDREIQGGRPFTVLFMDLDRFKTVNDTHGHLMGSSVLTEFARVLRSCVRDDDVLIRYGGDEFVAVLVGVGPEGAVRIAERIRRAAEKHRFLSREGLAVNLTVSIGVASYPEHAPAKGAILELADRAMYRAKETARNTVYIATQELASAAKPG